MGYSQTQKEALALFRAIRRLYKYLYGLRFTIITDHQAIQFLFNPNKSIAKSTGAMLQRWSLAPAAYNYDIQHSPGKTIPQHEFLSRYSRFSEAKQYRFISPASPVSRESLCKPAKQCYVAIISTIKEGWSPEVKRKYPQFFAHREEFSAQLNVALCRDDRMVILLPIQNIIPVRNPSPLRANSVVKTSANPA
ncbi:unnamed protein product [Echinostoma caproni]|uniref:RT_RNaseH domain-containing protein n=1 Tax=Echinostoma caproni TaxID=27848 RepID=A0A183B5X6_9TREM|nr:unnamed protein product [Echinostoma caproni]